MSKFAIRGRAIGLLLAASILTATPAGATAPAQFGDLPEAVRDGFASGLFALPPGPEGLPTSAVVGEVVIPIIRVAFSDSALVHPAAALEQSLFDSTGATPDGSLTEYYLWASGGRLRVRGQVVATVQLPFDRYYYSFDGYGLSVIATPNNSAGLATHAVDACDAQVDWNQFDRDHDGYVDMVWIVHAGPGAETNGIRRNLWSITSRLSSGWSNAGSWPTHDIIPGTVNQRVRVDRFTILPELSGLHGDALCEIGIFCHEFGHSLGLPDLYDTSSLGGAANAGPGNWSLMSTGAYGADGRTPSRPTHLGAWPLLFLGWADRLRVGSDSTVSLASVAEGGPVLEMWCNGEPSAEHFLIEQRSRTGFDRDLPSSGLLLYQIDEALVGARLASNRVNYGSFPALRVIEGDGDQDMMRGLNRGDANDPLPGAVGVPRLDDETTPSLRALTGATTGLAMEGLLANGARTDVHVQVMPKGWDVTRALADDATTPVSALGPSARLAHAGDGRDYLVDSEERDGVPRVVLRARTGSTWNDAVLVDDGGEAAAEPTVAALPGGDLVVAWTAGPTNASRVRVRTRVAGIWSPIATISAPGQVANSPSLSADGGGRVCAAWLGSTGTQPQQIWFLRFTYLFPHGQPRAVSTPTQVPSAPLVVCDAPGTAYVVWSERSVFPAGLYFVRSHPDSLPSDTTRLVRTTGYPQLAFGAAIDSTGALHTVWHVSGAGVSEIHWQRRPRLGPLSPRDSTIDAQGEGLRNPYVVADPGGGVHATWLRSQPWGAQVRYDRWRPERGWDFRSTALTREAEGDCDRPALVARGPDDVTVVFQSTTANAVAAPRTRTRGSALVADVPAPRPASTRVALGAAPNPLTAGAPFTLRGASAGERVDLFDPLGRRVAALTAGPDGRVAVGRSFTRDWSSGLYFARTATSARTTRFVVVR